MKRTARILIKFLVTPFFLVFSILMITVSYFVQFYEWLTDKPEWMSAETKEMRNDFICDTGVWFKEIFK